MLQSRGVVIEILEPRRDGAESIVTPDFVTPIVSLVTNNVTANIYP